LNDINYTSSCIDHTCAVTWGSGEVFNCLNKCPDAGLTLTEIAMELNAPKSSLFPIIHTLSNENFLSFSKVSSRYSIGFKAYEIGNTFIRKGGISEDIVAQMSSVVKECGETCHFARLVDGDVFYLFKVDSPEHIRMVASPGKRLPAYSTGIGKALISKKNKDEIIEMYPRGLYAETLKTITNFDTLYEQLSIINQTGLAFECEESTQFLRCIAVPIIKNNEIIAAVSVAVPTFRYSEEKEKLIINLLKESKKYIEKLISISGFTDYL